MEEIQQIIRDSIDVKEALLRDAELQDTLRNVIEKMALCLRSGGRLLLCGNGGSASDAQHIAAELSGRFYLDRPPLDAEALHVNTSFLTAVANDYGYEAIFSRAVAAKGRKGDFLIALSTSGNSPNVIAAAETAQEMGMVTVGLTGANGGSLTPHCDYLLTVPSKDTPRIQEAHILIGHIMCKQLEDLLFVQSPDDAKPNA